MDHEQSTRRGGIPGPESRTGLTRPSMTEAEFERRLGTQPAAADPRRLWRSGTTRPTGPGIETESAGRSSAPRRGPGPRDQSRPSLGGSSGCSRSRRRWTRSSGSTRSTWARIDPRSSTICSGRSSLRWSCTIRATGGAARNVELAVDRAGDVESELQNSEAHDGSPGVAMRAFATGRC